MKSIAWAGLLAPAAMPSAGYAYATVKAALVVAILAKIFLMVITPKLIDIMQISGHQTTLRDLRKNKVPVILEYLGSADLPAPTKSLEWK
ncbi:hypothetical protein, partial [Nostoc sp.]|uniref:hypothetical protein n=1 Tax=Nostoc sp. TaxID=1180 RepID=UPI002FF50156